MNKQGEYETRTEWHRVYTWDNLTTFAKTLLKGQLVSLEGNIKYRAIE
jgi:single-strand DNA-binding protein